MNFTAIIMLFEQMIGLGKNAQHTPVCHVTL